MFIFSVSMVFVFCLFRYKVVWLELVWQSSKSNVSVPVITRLKLVMALVAEFRYQSETEGFYDDNLFLHIFVRCFRAPSNQMTLNRAGAGRSLRLPWNIEAFTCLIPYFACLLFLYRFQRKTPFASYSAPWYRFCHQIPTHSICLVSVLHVNFQHSCIV